MAPREKYQTIQGKFPTPLPESTEAYRRFHESLNQLDHLVDMAIEQGHRLIARSERYMKRQEPATLAGLKRSNAAMIRHVAAQESFRGQVTLTLRLYAVLLVTFAETFLQDALAEAATAKPALMGDSKQAIEYAELGSFQSVSEIQEELRGRWARNFLDRGGPPTWIERLTRMGASFEPEHLGDVMDELWGIRHIAVHRSGRATRDFCMRHPGLQAKVGEVVMIGEEPILQYSSAVAQFTTAIDVFVRGLVAAAAAKSTPGTAVPPLNSAPSR